MSRPSGRSWAYAAAIVGAVVSVAANVGHSYVPPVSAPAGWRPQPGAVALAAFWPCAVVLAVEVLARVPWPRQRRWGVLRWGGLAPVALVAAVVSYRHLSGLLAWYGEDGVTVVLGPLAVDGLMTVATGALLATSGPRGSLVDVLELEDEGPSHLRQTTVRDLTDEAPDEGTAGTPPAEIPEPRRAARTPQTRQRAGVGDLLLAGRAVAADLERHDKPLTRKTLIEGLRQRGHAVSTTRGTELLRQLRAA